VIKTGVGKGHSFLGYFIFSLFLFPIALITAYAVQDRGATARTGVTRTDMASPTPGGGG
jgi:hypothetical protein